MDAVRAAPYVPRTVNLLLLLSALLSALTGVSGGARIEAPQVLSQALVDTAPAKAIAARVQARPVQALATIAIVAAAPLLPMIRAIEPAPSLLTNRRRE